MSNSTRGAVDIAIFANCFHVPFYDDAWTAAQRKSNVQTVRNLSLTETYLIERGLEYRHRLPDGTWLSQESQGKIHLFDNARLVSSSITGIVHIIMINPRMTFMNANNVMFTYERMTGPSMRTERIREYNNASNLVKLNEIDRIFGTSDDDETEESAAESIGGSSGYDSTRTHGRGSGSEPSDGSMSASMETCRIY